MTDQHTSVVRSDLSWMVHDDDLNSERLDLLNETNPLEILDLPKQMPTFTGSHFNYVSGEAKTLIAGLSLEAHNYKLAVDLLRQEYGDKKAIAYELQKQLMNLPSCNSFNQPKEFHLNLEKICRQLEAMGEPLETALQSRIQRSYMEYN
uniref:Uncharacterized protein n=1 Tax=Ditylenchus dipsaci TaxID=166011 RepID=A0A915DM72_9BILA